MKDNRQIEKLVNEFSFRYVIDGGRHLDGMGQEAEEYFRQSLTSTHNAAIDEALSLLPEREETNALDDVLDIQQAFGHNTAVALMRERLLDLKK